MRHQERIYIQNENSALRNKKLPNVNGSTDLYVFTNPTYSLTGTSKINCGCDCECPTGYTATTNCTICEKITVTASTFSGTAVTVTAGDTNGNYSLYGARFFQNVDDLVYPLNYSGTPTGVLVDNNGSGTPVTIQTTVNNNTLWASSGTTTYGRLNNVGIWMSPNINDVWFGFSHCLNIVSAGTYCIGISGDNDVRFKLNGEIILNLDNSSSISNYRVWHVLPITLEAGNNIIELEGLNDFSVAAFGAEIYSADVDVLSGLTTTAQLSAYTIFSTLDKVGSTYDLSATNGYSCPSGYSLSVCSGYTCVKIEKSQPQNSCSGITASTYIITASTQTIPLTFNFTANTESFTEANASFKYGVYKYDTTVSGFTNNPVFTSDLIPYSDFSATSATTQYLLASDLSLDGDYIVKGFYTYQPQTEFIKKLGNRIDTSNYVFGGEYGVYNKDLDYYFIAFKEAETPKINYSPSNVQYINKLIQQVILPDAGVKTITISNNISGQFILTLNGLALAPTYDYTFTGNVVTLNSETVYDDVITVIYTTFGGNNLICDNISIDSAIVSGTTDNQGSNLSYYNTTTGKYEVYTSVTPATYNDIILMLNGVTLANGIDYYPSISNPKRIILNGDIMIGDIITIAFFPVTSVVNGLNVSQPVISWNIDTTPELVNGYFTLEVSTGDTFSNYYYTGNTLYSLDGNVYSQSFVATGNTGDKLYYRVKNTKNYVNMCGNEITSTAYSEIIPITIQNNAINSY